MTAKCRLNVQLAALALLALAPVRARAETARSDQELPISVSVFVDPHLRGGEPIPVAVTLENGMKDAISYGTFTLDPVPWNGETASVALAEIHRNGQPENLLLARPAIKAPSDMPSLNHFVLKRGQSLSVKTDLSKWKIRGGWAAGRYTATVLMDNITTERGRRTLTLQSAPFSFEVRP